jgi:CRISPR-associated protein Csx14
VETIIIATLGGQPQIITLALDRLLPRIGGARSVELYLLNPASEPRYQQALTTVRRVFDTNTYRGVQLRVHVLRRAGKPIDVIDGAEAADAIYDTLHVDLSAHKATGATLHLLPTGGRRLLGMLLLSAAQAVCSRADRCWHLASSDAVRRASDGGAQLHLPETLDIQLVAVPLNPIGQYIAALRTAPPARDPNTQLRRVRQRSVWQQLTPRRREVLLALVRTDSPTLLVSVAAQLVITPKTLDEHKTAIFAVCHNVWELDATQRVTLTWLRAQFADFEHDGV